MKKSLNKIVAVLDGKPTGTPGQALVELTITLPIFVIMIVGMVEVGWYANNYLILNDVIRSAGRNGSLGNPTEDWLPNEGLNWERTDCDFTFDGGSGDDTFSLFPTDPKSSPAASVTALPGNYNGLETLNGLGYYDGVACTIISGMAPLEFKDDEDDIVVSVFSYANINGTIKVTGRYPSAQNECSSETRDPFDINGNGSADATPIEVSPTTELLEDATRYDAGGENIRGFVFRGNHRAEDDTSCFGSNFTVDWLETELQESLVQETGTISIPEIENVAAYGLVLVEIYWNSYQLLNLPVLGFADPIPAGVWAIFPVSAAEPDIQNK